MATQATKKHDALKEIEGVPTKGERYIIRTGEGPNEMIYDGENRWIFPGSGCYYWSDRERGVYDLEVWNEAVSAAREAGLIP